MKTVTFIESVHTENIEKILQTKPTNRTYKILKYAKQKAAEWAITLFTEFHKMEEQELVVINGLHHAVVATQGQYFYANHLVSGLFALGCGPVTLNIDYKSPVNGCDFNEDEIKYWLELTDTELIPLNDYAVDLFLDKEFPDAE